MIHYEESLSLRDARQRYFEASGFDDESYFSSWAKFPLGPFQFYIPNPPLRRQVVRLHDLHHIATGYDTSWLGEGEISAWEVASRGMPNVFIWPLIFSAIAIGFFISPRALWRAYQRGRGSRNLFRSKYSDEMLTQTVGQLCKTLSVN